MRKLLLILLLLFPVHGALGEILTLSCSYNSVYETESKKTINFDVPVIKIFNIDLKTKIINDAYAVRVNDNYITWQWEKSADAPGKYRIEYNSIDRNDGTLIAKVTEDISKEDMFKFMKTRDAHPKIIGHGYADCKKTSSKKKF